MRQEEPTNRLVLHEESTGPHFYLAGQPITDGDELEVRTPAGWVRGCFHWSGRVEFWPRIVPRDGERLGPEKIASFRRFGPDSHCRWPEAPPEGREVQVV
jgi:hypothetical protein